MEPFIGQLMLFAGNFPPRDWAFCDGQLLSIAQNTALFSILGTTYGGNGTTTFALPDLRGRVPVHSSNGTAGPGLSGVQLGESYGSEANTMLITQMPSHNHVATVSIAASSSDDESADSPIGAYLRKTPNVQTYADSQNGFMGPGSTATVLPTGGNQPFPVVQPSLGLNYCIALYGVFPSRG